MRSVCIKNVDVIEGKISLSWTNDLTRCTRDTVDVKEAQNGGWDIRSGLGKGTEIKQIECIFVRIDLL